MSDHHHKHQKKKLQILKNKHTLEVNLLNDANARSRDLEKEREEEMRAAGAASSRAGAARAAAPGNTVWSAKMQMIRDKNTGRQRMATERWNRFAGTEGGGGRGL